MIFIRCNFNFETLLSENCLYVLEKCIYMHNPYHIYCSTICLVNLYKYKNRKLEINVDRTAYLRINYILCLLRKENNLSTRRKLYIRTESFFLVTVIQGDSKLEEQTLRENRAVLKIQICIKTHYIMFHVKFL